MWDAVHGVGLRSVASADVRAAAAAPPMIETAAATGTTPLVVLVSSFAGKAYTFNVPYGVGKAAVDRLGSDMALQLKSKGVATTVLYPGVVRTEGNLEMDARGDWAAASGGLDLGPPFGETPAFTGRALTALLDLGGEALLERSGDVQVVAELARDLDFADVDGNRPPSIRSLAFLFPQFIFPQIEAESGQTVPFDQGGGARRAAAVVDFHVGTTADGEPGLALHSWTRKRTLLALLAGPLLLRPRLRVLFRRLLRGVGRRGRLRAAAAGCRAASNRF